MLGQTTLCAASHRFETQGGVEDLGSNHAGEGSAGVILAGEALGGAADGIGIGCRDGAKLDSGISGDEGDPRVRERPLIPTGGVSPIRPDEQITIVESDPDHSPVDTITRACLDVDLA
jgi:hypothetical protein